jgi:hypothetical protein
MKHLIQLVESAQQLDEGPVGKALATAALTLGLSFGNQVNAEEVFVYQDMQGQLQTATSMWDIPDDVMQSYVVDTDTQKIKYLKKPSQQQQQQQKYNTFDEWGKGVLDVIDAGGGYDVWDLVGSLQDLAVDPGSFTVKDLKLITFDNGTKVVVGKYLSKNRMGGYGGYSTFVATGNGFKANPGRSLGKSTWAQLVGKAGLSYDKEATGYFSTLADILVDHPNTDLGSFTVAGGTNSTSLFGGGMKLWDKIGKVSKIQSLPNPFETVGGGTKTFATDTVANASNNTIVDAAGIGVYLDKNKVTVGSTEYSDLQKGDIITHVQYKSKKYNIATTDGFKQFIDSNKGKKVVVYGTRNGKSFFTAIGL